MQVRDAWNIDFMCFSDYFSRHGVTPGRKSGAFSPSKSSLYGWYIKQRSLARDGGLSPDRMKLMDGLLGREWYLGSTGIVVPIPDVGLNYSISSMYRVGAISYDEYRFLFENEIYYIEDYFAYCNSRSAVGDAVVGRLTSRRVYELAGKDLDLPEWRYVVLYCVIVGKSLVEIFARKSRSDIYGIRNISRTFANIKSRLDSRYLDVLMSWLSRDPVIDDSSGNPKGGYLGVEASLGISHQSALYMLHRCFKLIRNYTDFVSYDGRLQLQLLSPECSRSIAVLGFSPRSYNVLSRSGFGMVRDLSSVYLRCKSSSELAEYFRRLRFAIPESIALEVWEFFSRLVK